MTRNLFFSLCLLFFVVTAFVFSRADIDRAVREVDRPVREAVMERLWKLLRKPVIAEEKGEEEERQNEKEPDQDAEEDGR